MRAIRYHELGGPEVLRCEHVPTPEPAAGEVLIKVAAAGLNYADLNRIRGIYPVPDPLPSIIGQEAAGTVEAVGTDVEGFVPGDRVMAWIGRGCFAEYVAAAALSVRKIPEAIDSDVAAALQTISVTAYHLLKTRARVQPGETVLIHAGASGVGSTAVQLAKHWGARVIATASSDEKLARVGELGADFLINYSEVDFQSEVLRLTEGRGVDIVLEQVGGDVLTRSIACLAPVDGRLILYGRSSGGLPDLNAADLFTRNISIITLHLGMPVWTPDRHDEAFAEILALVAAGTLRPIIDRVLPLEDAAQAFRHLGARQAVGKVLLRT
jgi:NADPH2:quinone reductase